MMNRDFEQKHSELREMRAARLRLHTRLQLAFVKVFGLLRYSSLMTNDDLSLGRYKPISLRSLAFCSLAPTSSGHGS